MEESAANAAYRRVRSRGRPRGKARGRPRGRPRRAQSSSTVTANHSLAAVPPSNLPHSRGTHTHTTARSPRTLTPKEEAAEKLLADIIAKVENANASGRVGLYQVWSEFSTNDKNCLPGLEVRSNVSIKKIVSAANSEVEWIFYNRNPWGLTEDEINNYSDDIEISHDSNGLLTISLSRQGDESEDGDDDNSSIWTVGAHKISAVDKQGQHDFAKGALGVENESGRRLKSVMQKRNIFDMHEVIIDPSCSAFVIWTDLEDEIPVHVRWDRCFPAENEWKEWNDKSVEKSFPVIIQPEMRMLRPSPLHRGPPGTRTLATIFNSATEEFLGTACKLSELGYSPPEIHSNDSKSLILPEKLTTFSSKPLISQTKTLPYSSPHGPPTCRICRGKLLLFMRNVSHWACQHPAHKDTNSFSAHDIPYYCPRNCLGAGKPNWICCQACYQNDSSGSIQTMTGSSSATNNIAQKLDAGSNDDTPKLISSKKLKKLEYRRKYYLNRRMQFKAKQNEEATAAAAAASVVATWSSTGLFLGKDPAELAQRAAEHAANLSPHQSKQFQNKIVVKIVHYIDEHELSGEDIARQHMCDKSKDKHDSSDTYPVEFIIRKRKSDEVDRVEQLDVQNDNLEK